MKKYTKIIIQCFFIVFIANCHQNIATNNTNQNLASSIKSKNESQNIRQNIRQNIIAKSLILKANNLGLHQEKYWLILLHYQQNLTRKNSSTVENGQFFLAPNGKYNPQEELEFSITALLNPDKSLADSHFICKYPARTKWLKEKLAISENLIPKIQCSSFNQYQKNLSAQKISLALASENINNLTTMMGHLFLKIEGKNQQNITKKHALSYYANLNPNNNIKFLFGTIFGGAPGVFILEPYQDKVKEYQEKEKRSVWEFDLTMSQEQIDRILLHIWELKGANISYNFIHHNCGNALLFVLLTGNYDFAKNNQIFDAPLDIIKNLDENGFINNVKIDPESSYRYKMAEYSLAKQDRKIIEKFIKTKDIKYLKTSENENTKATNVNVARIALDSLLNNSKIKYQEYLMLNKEINEIPVNSNVETIYKINNPLTKSKSSQVNLSFQKGGGDNGDVLNIGFYPVYNDIFSDNQGYFNEFTLQILNFSSGYNLSKSRFRIENIDIIKIKSIIDYNKINKGLSGNFRINFEQEDFSFEKNRLFFNGNAGLGLATEDLSSRVKIYSILNLGYASFNNNIFYANPEIGLIAKEKLYNREFGKFLVSYNKYLGNKSFKYNQEISVNQIFFLSTNRNINLNYRKIRSDISGKFNDFKIEYRQHF